MPEKKRINKYIAGRYATTDEINFLKEMNKDFVVKYEKTMKRRADWGRLDPVAIQQYIDKRMGR